jgi:ribonucleoside-diphosphate reductase alpha chain
MPHQNPAIQKLLEERYFLRDKEGNLIEHDPEDMFNRVATAIAKAEYQYTDNPNIANNNLNKYLKIFYDMMNEGRFMPNTPCLANAGKNNFSYFACFTVPIEDSMESIYDTLKNTAMIARGGGGWGINFTPLREEGSLVSRTGQGSSGPISFLKVFDASTDVIKAGGMRRGASIALLDVSHPDILQFIECKDETGELTNFNISVTINRTFMEYVKRDWDWSLVSPSTNKEVRRVKAREIWRAICEHAWKTGEPGIIFTDNVNYSNSNPYTEKKEHWINTCNPCWDGNTEVLLGNGSWVRFKTLAQNKKDINVVSMDPGCFRTTMKMREPRKTGKLSTLVIEVSNGNVTTNLIMTPNHKLFLSDRYHQVEAKDLGIGDQLYTVKVNDPEQDGKDNFIVMSISSGEVVDVYNGTVDTHHNYIVKCSDEYGILSANCGELPMPTNTSCVLGSLNLSAYFDESKPMSFDIGKFVDDIHSAVRFLDNCIDVSPYPLPEIEKNTKAERRIGLGVMGWADLLLKLHIPYDSEEALKYIDYIGKTLNEESLYASMHLAQERDVFPNWSETIYAEDPNCPVPLRNCTRTTIAPAGSISRIIGCSSGLEPIFSPKIHHKLATIEYDEIHPAWNVDLQTGDDQWLVTSHDITPDWHLAHVINWQRHINSAISKTINLPNSATVEDIEEIYMTAEKNGVKGITVYRDGCRNDQPLTNIDKSLLPIPETYLPSTIESFKTKRYRGSIAFGPTHKVQTQQGKAYVTINYVHEEDDPVEVFIRLGDKATSREHEFAEWCGRLLSLLLKHNVPIDDIIRQANKIHGDSPIVYVERIFNSLPKLVSHMLSLSFTEALNQCNLVDDIGVIFEPDFELSETEVLCPDKLEPATGEYCSECGTYSVVRESGCLHCLNCDWSKCG